MTINEGGDDDETTQRTDGTTITSSSLTDVLMRRSSPLVIAERVQQDGISINDTATSTVVMRRSSTSPHTSRTTTGGSPLRLTNRPRSNPRTRTPMRYESPIEANTFNRINIREEDETEVETAAGGAETTGQPRMEGRRITIRPMAGRAVGTVTVSCLYISKLQSIYLTS